MRAMIMAMLLATGIGAAGIPGASAAPVADGAALRDRAAAIQPIEQVQHWRWGSRGGHWRWGSRGPRLCHRPYTSRYFRCW